LRAHAFYKVICNFSIDQSNGFFPQLLSTNILLTLLVPVGPYVYFSDEKVKFDFYSTLGKYNFLIHNRDAILPVEILTHLTLSNNAI